MKKNGVITREKLLAQAKRLPSERVDIPEWGGSVFVRGMSTGDFNTFRKEVAGADENDSARDDKLAMKILVRSIVDDKGVRLLKDDEDHVIESLPSSVYRRLVDAMHAVNGYGSAAGNS